MIKFLPIYKFRNTGLYLLLLTCCTSIVYGQDTTHLSLENAILITLQNSPEIKLQEQLVQQNEANVRLATGLFDYKAFSDVRLSQDRRNVLPIPISTDFDRILRDTFGINTVATNQVSLNLGVSRQLRNGVFVQTTLGTGRVLSDIPFPSPFEQFTSENITNARLQVAVPLLKNRGGKISQSTEIAAKQLVTASEQQMQFVITNQVLQTALAYWNYQALWKNLNIYQQAEQRAKAVLENSKSLIEAEKKPAADLAQIEGDFAVKISSRMLAEQAVFQARQNLGRAMGLDYQESAYLGLPLSNFPTVKGAGNIDQLLVDNLLQEVISGRPDLLAQQQLIQAQETISAAAKQNILPKLDANFFLQHSGLQYGNNLGNYFTPFTASQGRTINYGGSISLKIPIQNNVPKGNFQKENAILLQEQINYENQFRNIKTNLSIAINQLKISKNVLVQSQIAYNKFKETFENEKIKYQRGLTTLLNLILFQDLLTNAELNYIKTQQQFAEAIALLRFESGTIQKNLGVINATVFLNIPK